MAYDPLSPTTRKTRVSLLIFCSVALIVQLYEIYPTNIPLLGIDEPVPSSFLPSILAVGIFYLCISFLAYLRDDISEYAPTERVSVKSSEIFNRTYDIKNSLLESEGNRDELQRRISKNKSELGLFQELLESNMLEVTVFPENRIKFKSKSDLKQVITERISQLKSITSSLEICNKEIWKKKRQLTYSKIRFLFYNVRYKGVFRFWVVDIGIPVSMVFVVAYIWIADEIPVLCSLTKSIPACPAPPPP